MNELIAFLAPIMAWLIVILGILTMLSLIMTGFYLIAKRLAANIWGAGMYLDFVVHKVREQKRSDKPE